MCDRLGVGAARAVGLRGGLVGRRGGFRGGSGAGRVWRRCGGRMRGGVVGWERVLLPLWEGGTIMGLVLGGMGWLGND